MFIKLLEKNILLTLLTLIFFSSFGYANINENEIEDDTEVEEPTLFSMSGTILLGIPAQGSKPQTNEVGYNFNLEPEWKVTSHFAAFGSFIANQNFSFDDGISFNQSDLGLKYSGQKIFDLFEPTFIFSTLLPFNSLEVVQDSYRGGLSPAIKLAHMNAAKNIETNLTLSYVLLRHISETTNEDLSNVHSYSKVSLAGEYFINANWTLNGDINYSLRKFYNNQTNAIIGFDLYNSFQVFSKKEVFALIGLGNYPVQRTPEDLNESLPIFNQNLNFIYTGIRFEI